MSIIRHLLQLPGCAKGSGCKYRGQVDIRLGRTSQSCARRYRRAGREEDPASSLSARFRSSRIPLWAEGGAAGGRRGEVAEGPPSGEWEGRRGGAGGEEPGARGGLLPVSGAASMLPAWRCSAAPPPSHGLWRARLPPAPRGAAGAKTAICSQTSEAGGSAPPPL